jgi:hypothetical protein
MLSFLKYGAYINQQRNYNYSKMKPIEAQAR